ncbi:hypothetical protein [Marivita sp. XM-24bin2]|jgi:hypothetical protein|uniref:hypothetical protein n=1 Tax=unclassified Marivita TaxID=2632480 RepID=UPI0025C1AC87|nr:hypothetical protein [Marivita sp. XM-24bin2]
MNDIVRNILISTSIAVSLSACSAERSDTYCLEYVCTSNFGEPGFKTKVPGVVTGMTRSEVVEVLGANFIPFEALHLPPQADSFPYEEDGETKYIWVEYWKGTVSRADRGFDHTYRIE